MKIATRRGPRVLISGLGHTGTSFVANLFYAMGAGMGSELQGGPGVRKGMEWRPFHLLCAELARKLGEGALPDVLPLWERLDRERVQEVMDEFAPRFRKLEYPAVVKNPESGHWGFLNAINPGYMVICARDLDEWAESMIHGQEHARNADREALKRAGKMQQDHILDKVAKLGVSHSVVSFPEMVESWRYAWDRLADGLVQCGAVSRADSDKFRFRDTHDRLARQEWIGLTARTRPFETASRPTWGVDVI